jgi:hypothetical protein
VGGDGLGEGLDFGLGKAVEEEVGDDEVGVGRRADGEGGALEDSDAVDEGLAAVVQKLQHGGAAIDGQGPQVGPVFEEAGEEAAVAISEEEGLMAGWEFAEEVSAGALQERAKGEVLGEAVDAGYAVEVGEIGG